jgi:hypothetical protein
MKYTRRMSRADRAIVIEGRFCSDAFGFSCCLPCPQTEWLYANNFDSVTTAMDWVNVVGMICSVFLLVSFVVLPVKKTHRHYLSVCLAISIAIMQVRPSMISSAREFA